MPRDSRPVKAISNTFEQTQQAAKARHLDFHKAEQSLLKSLLTAGAKMHPYLIKDLVSLFPPSNPTEYAAFLRASSTLNPGPTPIILLRLQQFHSSQTCSSREVGVILLANIPIILTLVRLVGNTARP